MVGGGGGGGGGLLLLGSSSASVEEEADEAIELPPGFRFHPTDEEIIMHYLLEKAVDRGFTARAISEADLNKCEPWDLPEKAKMGEKEWFFFFQRDRKYPTGMRTNRATESGYWKATGKDKEIYYKPKNYLVGMKKTLVFYKGRAPKGDKTNWVMHEYRLEGDVTNYNISRAAKEEFVVCRVFHKTIGIRKPPAGLELAAGIDLFVDRLSDGHMLPPLMDYTNLSYKYMEGLHETHEDVRSKEHTINNSSSRVFLSNHQLQYPQYYDPRSYFVTPQECATNTVLPASIFPYQAQTPLGYHQLGEGLGSMISSYHPNMFPFKGGYDRENLRPVTPRMEQYISTNNSLMSHSEETGLSTENVESKGDVESDNINPFDGQELHGLGYSPGISDLDSLWSY